MTHVGLFKKAFKPLIKQIHLVGEKQMSSGAVVTFAVKAEKSRKGGVAPCQLVLGRFPRDTGRMLEEEEERDRLGVLYSQHERTRALSSPSGRR